MDSKDLTVFIVTFKSEAKIFKCVESIPDYLRVIIVENSNNESFKKSIENKFQNVECILTGDNKGYAVANNIGLRKVKTRNALVLNPDATLSSDAIKNFFITKDKIRDFCLLGPANDQMVNLNFEKKKLIEVNDLKGFAIFFNMTKFKNEFFDENYFLYFEEIDLCKTLRNKGEKIFLDHSITIQHDGASSVDNFNEIEIEKSRNWHWMWSSFYFHKKHKGFLLALIIMSPKLISSIIKSFFYLVIFDKEKRNIYHCRLSGILNSILGKKSWYRPVLD